MIFVAANRRGGIDIDEGCGGRIEVRVFNNVIAGIKKSRQKVDANHALREWCGRGGGTIPRNA